MIEKNPHLRPAQAGDICLLIEPGPQTDITPLRDRQKALYSRYGGNPSRHVHLTCQRVCCGSRSRLDECLCAVEQFAAALMPLPINAVGLHTLAVPILQTTTLKWQIDVTPTLLQFNARLTNALRAAGFMPQYAPGFTSNLVTALQGMDADLPDDDLADPQLPYHLFDAKKIVVSKICGPGKFEILGKIGVVA